MRGPMTFLLAVACAWQPAVAAAQDVDRSPDRDRAGCARRDTSGCCCPRDLLRTDPPLVIGAPQLRPAVPRPTSVLGMARESWRAHSER